MDILPEEDQRIRLLWIAVMARVVSDLKGYGCADPDDKRGYSFQRGLMQQDARQYVESLETNVGSFEWVCMILGFDADRARDRLLTAPHKQVKRPDVRDRRDYMREYMKKFRKAA
jgi:hypothetical protein